MNTPHKQPALGLIWAQGRNSIIGHQGQMPWHLPEDLAHFKTQTLGCPVIMGRKTWDSIPPQFRPLPGRRNIVITRQQDWRSTGAEVAHTIEHALSLCAGERRVWVLGGGQIYEQAMPYADLVEMTQIDLAPKGDTRAPKLDDEWERLRTTEWRSSRTGLRYRFATYQRLLATKTLDASFSSSLQSSGFASTQAPTTVFESTQPPTGFDSTQASAEFENTEPPAEFERTLPPGLTS